MTEEKKKKPLLCRLALHDYYPAGVGEVTECRRCGKGGFMTDWGVH